MREKVPVWLESGLSFAPPCDDMHNSVANHTRTAINSTIENKPAQTALLAAGEPAIAATELAALLYLKR
jgi:hypothetical protein